MSAARKLITFGGELSLCEPARRIVEPTPAEIIALNPRRPTGGRSRGRAGGIEGAPRNPTTIVTSVPIVEWWRADLGVTTGATLNWVGQKNGTVLTQGTAAAQPTYSASDAAFGGKSSFTADGVNDFLTSTLAVPAPGTTARYYWFVFKAASTSTPATTNVIFCGNANFCEEVAQLNTNGQHSSYNGVALSTSIATVTSARRGEAGFTNSTADFFSYGATSVTGVNTGNNPDATGWGLFSHGGVDSFWAGSLAEILITGGIPTDSERAALDAYGAVFYGSSILT